MPRIRTATLADVQGIKRLVRVARLNPIGIDWRRFLIAEDQRGQLLGCGQIKAHADGSKELASLVVVPAWRGRGVARQLVETLMGQSGPPLWLTCRSGLISFYNRFGFREVRNPARMPFYFKLALVFGKLLRLFWTGDGYLAIMSWNEEGRIGSGRPSA